MPTPTELIKKKIRHREDILRARDAETAAREAELEDLKESLQKLQSARSGIRAAIKDAIEGDPEEIIAPNDLLEMAVEGNTNLEPFGDPFANGNISAEEVVNVALISMRHDLGRRDLVKTIIQTAVEVSQLDAEGVIKAALETVRACDLTSADIIRVALQAARNANHISAADIIAPAVGTAIEMGLAAPVVAKQAFVSAVRRDPSQARTSVLSVLGCALGMGMGYSDIREILEAFLREMELCEEVEGREGSADRPSGTTSVAQSKSPEESHDFDRTESQSQTKSQDSDQTQTQEPENTQSPDPSTSNGSYADDADPPVVGDTTDAALEPIETGGPGMPDIGDTFITTTKWPGEDVVVHNNLEEGAASTAGKPAKRAESWDNDQPQGPPSKKIKLNYADETPRGGNQ